MTFVNTLLPIILLVLWNIITVSFLTVQARKGILTPMKFSITFVLGFSFTISAILFIVISIAEGIGSRGIGFSLFIFIIIALVSFPIIYFVSKIFLSKIFPLWSSKTHHHESHGN